MPPTVSFNVDALLGRLNAVEGTQIKYAGTQAMKRLGFQLKQELSRHMQQIFRNPVPFTLSSPLYSANGLELTMYLNSDGAKGQPPSKYLYPVSTDDTTGAKPAYPTRFAKALRHKGIIDQSYFPVPWLAGRAVPTNDYGNVPPSFYQSVLAGLERHGAPGKPRTKQAGYQIFSVPDRRIGPAVRRTSSLKPGIYRAKGSQLDFLFGYARRPPIVRTSFDFAGFTTRRAEALLPALLRDSLSRATGN
jgi:hypothetical protein